MYRTVILLFFILKTDYYLINELIEKISIHIFKQNSQLFKIITV